MNLVNRSSKKLKITVMKITSDLNLRDFDFWSGAKDHNFTLSELEDIESILEDIYPDGMTDTQVNDLFWFEDMLICDWLGINHEDYLNR